MSTTISLIECPNCHDKTGTFDAKTLKYYCNFCHNTFIYQRKDIVTNDSVAKNAENAVKMFSESSIDLAYQTSCSILEVSFDNAPASFIVSYYREIILHEKGQFAFFFNTKMKPFINEEDSLEGSEVLGLEKLFYLSAKKLMDFEYDILRLLNYSSNTEELEYSMLDFVEKVCPYWISNRETSEFLTPELVQIYKQMVRGCTLPKTCKALYDAIVSIPDSPIANNSFFLKTKCKHFYDNFILPIGEIISEMQNEQTREKYSAAFEKRRKLFVEKSGIE